MNEHLERQEQTREEKILNQLRAKLSSLYSGASKFEFHEKMVAFAEQLREHYPDSYSKYRLYHTLIQSTPKAENPPTMFDFPGNDSIEKFINEQHQPRR